MRVGGALMGLIAAVWVCIGPVHGPPGGAAMALVSQLLAPPAEAPAQEAAAVRPPDGVRLIWPWGGGEVIEGAPALIVWQSGPNVAKVSVWADFERCRLGGRSRGEGRVWIARRVEDRGFVRWTPPWIDAPRLTIVVRGLDEQGRIVGEDACRVQLRPKEAVGLHGTFILVLRRRQRLYYFADDKLVRMHIVSTGRAGYRTPRMWPGRRVGGARAGMVFNKMRWAYSQRYHSPMPYWLAITSNGMIGIHATVPSAYRRLGRPASHGCIRQHLADARALYNLVAVGTPVYVY